MCYQDRKQRLYKSFQCFLLIEIILQLSKKLPIICLWLRSFFKIIFFFFALLELYANIGIDPALKITDVYYSKTNQPMFPSITSWLSTKSSNVCNHIMPFHKTEENQDKRLCSSLQNSLILDSLSFLMTHRKKQAGHVVPTPT